MRRIVELSGKGEPSARLLQRRIIAFHRYGHEFHGAARKTGSPLIRLYLNGSVRFRTTSSIRIGAAWDGCKESMGADQVWLPDGEKGTRA